MLLFEPWEFAGNQPLRRIRIADEIFVANLEESLMTIQRFGVGVHFAPQANIGIIHVLVLAVAADNDIARITNHVDDVKLRIFLEYGLHVHRVFGALGQKNLAVVSGYKVESNLVIVVLVDFETRDHGLVQ